MAGCTYGPRCVALLLSQRHVPEWPTIRIGRSVMCSVWVGGWKEPRAGETLILAVMDVSAMPHTCAAVPAAWLVGVVIL